MSRIGVDVKLPEALRRRIERHRLLFVGDRAQNLVSAISALHFFGQELRELVLRGPDSAPATTLLPASDTEEALGILDDIEAVAATLASANWLNVWGGLGVLNTTGPARLNAGHFAASCALATGGGRRFPRFLG